mgnify:CR=1
GAINTHFIEFAGFKWNRDPIGLMRALNSSGAIFTPPEPAEEESTTEEESTSDEDGYDVNGYDTSGYDI